MTYTKEQFLEDVAKESRALKKNATKEELSKLKYSDLNSNHTRRCVYGLLTGHCDSARASELIKKCAPIFFKSIVDYSTSGEFETFYWSPIERYLPQDNAKNANLIAFLKGERKDLVL